MSARGVVTGMLVLFGSLTMPLAAHHSGTMFEEKKTVTLEGVVKEFQYTNPHSWLLVDVTNKDGSVTTWGFEAEGPSTLARAGIKPSDFAAGTRISITGRPMKDGRPAANGRDVTFANGKKVFVGSGTPGAAADATAPY